MAGQTTKAAGNFLGAVRAHARDETNYGVDLSALPNGISNGRARVFAAGIGTYKKGDNEGKRFVRFAATVLSPNDVIQVDREFRRGGEYGPKGQVVVVARVPRQIAGLQTSQMYALCDDARGTIEENTQYMLNELRRTMGDENFTAPLEKAATEEQAFQILEALLARVKAEKPVIKFGTSDMQPTADRPGVPRVFENWYGRAEDLPTVVVAGAAPAGLNGHAANGSAANGHAPAAATGLADNTAKPFDETQNDALVAGDDLPADDDWDGWVERFNSLDDGSTEKDEAIDKLTEMATAAGVDQEAVEGADDWDAVKVLMDDAQAGATAEPPPESADPEPAKGDVYFAVLPKDPKKPMKGKAKVPVLIETVNKAAKTVTGKNNTTKQKVVDKDGKALTIPFSDLSVD